MFKINLKKLWLGLTGFQISKTRLQSYTRQQEKFKKRYPSYTIGSADKMLSINEIGRAHV